MILLFFGLRLIFPQLLLCEQTHQPITSVSHDTNRNGWRAHDLSLSTEPCLRDDKFKRTSRKVSMTGIGLIAALSSKMRRKHLLNSFELFQLLKICPELAAVQFQFFLEEVKLSLSVPPNLLSCPKFPFHPFVCCVSAANSCVLIHTFHVLMSFKNVKHLMCEGRCDMLWNPLHRENIFRSRIYCFWGH